MLPGLTDSDLRYRPNSEKRGMPPAPCARRFALWIDGVGSYLGCWSNSVTIGQAGSVEVDIPLLANIARRHGVVHRVEGNYTLEAWAATKLGGRSLEPSSALVSGDEFSLGETAQLRFTLPHPLSRTARLDVVSRHRTQPFSEAILLFSETCILGPRSTSHVVCREWSADVVLYRQQDRLWCRSSAPIEIDGQLYDSCGELGVHSRVVGCDFSFSIEWI